MDNARDALQFEITPCPRCGKKFTVADVERLDYNDWAILHNCPVGPGKGFYCYGRNLRMTVQNWNKYMEELKRWPK